METDSLDLSQNFGTFGEFLCRVVSTDLVTLNHGQVTWLIPELAPPSPNFHTTPTGVRFSLDISNVHRHPLHAARGLLSTDHVILNHGQVTWTTPELAPPLLTTTPHQREDVSALDRFNVLRCPTRRVFSGTGLELVTKQATVRYLYHSATAATGRIIGKIEEGRKITAVAREIDIAHSVVSRLWKSFKTTGMRS
ncbi:uncharacterized protein TNCV_3841221 [Trichonephila clavipes]|nr:uncharacterized protein TNCV_3841221 [Trichonephila clavipes]